MTHREARKIIETHKEIRKRYQELKPDEKSKSSAKKTGSNFELDLGFGE